MTAVSVRVRRPAITRPEWGNAGWFAAAAILGVAIGLAAALQQTTIAVAIVLLPMLVALVARPAWLPAVVVASAFGEAATSGSVTLSRLVGPVALMVMILALPRWTGVRLPRVGVLLAALAYVAWAGASALWTVDPNSGFQLGGTGYAMASLALSIVYMLAIIMFVQREADIRRLVQIIWFLSTFAGAVSIAQYASGYTRALGLAGDANYFAALQVVALPFQALLANQVENTKTRLIVLGGLAITVGSIITSLSRGGILALATVFFLLALQPARGFFRSRSSKRTFLLVAAIGAGILLLASFSALSARTSSLFTTGDGGSGRTNLWQAALTGWRQTPITGMGFGAFIGQSNRLLVSTPGVNFSAYRLRSTGQVVHNVYLESLTELGVIGLALFLGLLVTVALALIRTARRAARVGATYLSSFARAMLLSLAGFAFTSIFLSTETSRMFWVLLGFSVAVPRVLFTEERLLLTDEEEQHLAVPDTHDRGLSST